ncbi:hypothetical protein ES708_09321 [subsurface metagenome]
MSKIKKMAHAGFILSLIIVCAIFGITAFKYKHLYQDSLKNYEYLEKEIEGLVFPREFNYNIYLMDDVDFYSGSIGSDNIKRNFYINDYTYYLKLDHFNRNPKVYCLSDKLEPILEEIIDESNKKMQEREERNSTNIELVWSCLDFVQGIPWTNDSLTRNDTDYWRYPVETLFDYGGDCEDHAILFASLVKFLDVKVILISAYVADEDLIKNGHMLAGIWFNESNFYLGDDTQQYLGKEYYICETTPSSSNIGDNPWDVYNMQNIWAI